MNGPGNDFWHGRMIVDSDEIGTLAIAFLVLAAAIGKLMVDLQSGRDFFNWLNKKLQHRANKGGEKDS